MGVRSELAIVISKDGWAKFIDYVSLSLAESTQEEIAQLIDITDHRKVSANGDHLLFWSSIKSYADDVERLLDAVQTLDEREYYIVNMYEEGEPDYFGDHLGNDFNIYPVRKLNLDIESCQDLPSGIDSSL